MSLLLLFGGEGTPVSDTAPVVTTDRVATITKNSARAYGTVSSDGGQAVTERGFVISTSANPTTSDTKFTVTGTTGAFEKLLTSLLVNTVYHIRAYAINSVGTGYGADISFATFSGLIKKHYFYKVFDNNTYVTTWTKEVISEPSFRSVINGGVGEISIELARKFDDFGEDVDVKLRNKVEVYVVDKENINGLLLYTGYITGYRPVVDGPSEKVVITVWSYVAELQRMILRDSSGNTTLTYNSYDPANILKDVIDKYRALGGSINYSATSIALTNTEVSYTFNTNTLKECVDKIIELCPVGWFWRVDADNIIYLQPKKIVADHNFLLGKHVEKLETFRRIEDIINRVLFIGGGNPALFRKYENTASQDSYGLNEVKRVDQRVTVVATASTVSNRLIDAQKDPEIRSKFTIIDSNGAGERGYDIETVKVGQTLQIGNLKTGQKTITLWDQAVWDVDVWDQTIATQAVSVIQIISIEYAPDAIIIEASSRLPQIAKRIEDIDRNLQVTQMTNNPAAPT